MKKLFIALAASAMCLCSMTAQAQQTLQEVTDSIKNVLALANQGNADAQNTVGAWYYDGKHVTQDYEKAAKYWALSTKQGNVMATGNLAMCYLTGNGVRQDSVYALQLYNNSIKGGNIALLEANEALANGGNVFFCVQTAYCMQRGIGTPKNLNKAIQLYEKAAKRGSIDAMRELGLLYLNTQKPTEAYEWMQKGAKLGNITCIYWTGKMLLNGEGVSQDKEAGFNLLLQAANEGFGNAQYEVANAYLKGEGTVKSVDKGIEWLKRAANNEVSKAQFQLGIAYIYGDGVNIEYSMAANWLAVAAPKGHINALTKMLEPGGELYGSPFHSYLLGLRYYYEKDYDNALKLFKALDKAKRYEGKLMESIVLMTPDYPKYNLKKGMKALQDAAKKNVPLALYYLGYYYETGENGIECDQELGLENLQRAVQLGQSDAICYLGDMYYEGRGVEQDYKKAVDLYLSVRALLTPSALKRLAACYDNGWGGLSVNKKEAEALLKRQTGTVVELVAKVPLL